MGGSVNCGGLIGVVIDYGRNIIKSYLFEERSRVDCR